MHPMVMEVYTGATSARPRLMLVLGAATLAATLGLAWFQVRGARALGPEQRVADTPLWVQLPKEWIPDPEHPGRFLLAVKDEGWRRKAYGFERRIAFAYDRLPCFRSVSSILDSLDLNDSRTVTPPVPVHVGPYAGIEVRKFEPVAISRTQVMRRELIVRLACLPDGHLIQIVYEPLSELRPADTEILDGVCQTLRVDEPTVNGPPEQLLRQAGLGLAVEHDWKVVGPGLEEVPGVYVGGGEDGLPVWSVGIFRTWLAAGRTPRDLLTDLAAEHWELWDVQEAIREVRRPDGATTTSIRHPRLGQTQEPMLSALVVQQSPASNGRVTGSQSASQAAILLVYADEASAALADEAAGRIADKLELLPLDAIPSVEAVEQAGEGLVAKLNDRGPVPRWGRESVETRYAGRTPFGNEFVVVNRQARQRDPEQGYEGGQARWAGAPRDASPDDLVRLSRRSPPAEKIRWTVSGHAAPYDWRADYAVQSPLERLWERRRDAQGDVVRDVTFKGREAMSFRYRPGAAFVPPPLEEIIAGWVARDETGTALIEVSSRLGPGTHTQLLRRLPPSENFPRVLVQDDYWPAGVILTFDDDQAETQREVSATATYERIVPADRVPASPK